MVFDEKSNMFVLTNDEFKASGFDLDARLAATQSTNATAQINGFFLTVSELIYEYIHAHNTANDRQDRILHRLDSAKRILNRALMAQAEYMYRNGNLALSTDERDVDAAISSREKNILETTIPELGTCIIYTGYLPWI